LEEISFSVNSQQLSINSVQAKTLQPTVTGAKRM